MAVVTNYIRNRPNGTPLVLCTTQLIFPRLPWCQIEAGQLLKKSNHYFLFLWNISKVIGIGVIDYFHVIDNLHVIDYLCVMDYLIVIDGPNSNRLLSSKKGLLGVDMPSNTVVYVNRALNMVSAWNTVHHFPRCLPFWRSLYHTSHCNLLLCRNRLPYSNLLLQWYCT